MKEYRRTESSNVNEKLGNLTPEEIVKMWFISTIVIRESSRIMAELFQKYNLRWQFALYKYDSYKSFAGTELFNACEDLTHIGLSFDWKILWSEIHFQSTKEGKLDNQSKEVLSESADRMRLLLWDIISDAGLKEEYLKLDYDEPSPHIKFKPSTIPKLTSFNKITMLIGRLRYLELLKEILTNGEYNHSTAGVKKILPTLPEAFRNIEDFHSYLTKPQILELYDIYEDGTYHLKRGKKVYLAGFAHKLLNSGKLVDEIKTSQDLAKVFCTFFHVNFDSKEEKQFQPERAKVDAFNYIK